MQWIIVAIALVIFLQDFLSRSVHAILFVLLAVLGAVIQLQHATVKEFMVNSCINVVIITVQVAVAVAVIRKKQMIGAGDILFMAACCLVFAPFSFLLFLISSFFAALLMHVVFMRNSLYVRNGSTVALAGWQSLVLIVFICLDVISDEWIVKFLV